MASCPECLSEQQIQAIASAVANYQIPENTTPMPKPIPKPKLVKRKNSSS